MGRAGSVLKIAFAATLIGLLFWLVPIRDQLALPGATEQTDRIFSGSIRESDDAGALFDSREAGLLRVERSEGEITAVLLPSGERYVPPPGRPARLEDGVITVARKASLPLLAVTLLLYAASSATAALRWHLLLAAANLRLPFWRVYRLTYYGQFFNNFMPGVAGGDLVKAVYIARDHAGQRTEAIITVLVDRVLGITALLIVAGLAIPLDFASYGAVAPWIYGLLLAEVAGGCVFFSRRIRALLRVDALLSRLPLGDAVAKIDQAVFLYRYRPRAMGLALLLSLGVQLLVIGGIAVTGIALDIMVPARSYYAVIPIGLIVAALPIAPAGWGVGEAAFVYFWGTVGVSQARALALALLFRLGQMVNSLLGGILLLFYREPVREGEGMALETPDP